MISSKDSDNEIILEKKAGSADVAIQKQALVEKPRTEKEIQALKVGDAQVKRYWKERENERISKRGEITLRTCGFRCGGVFG